MAGQFRFKNNSGTVVAQISASNAGAISFSGSAVDFSSVATLTLGTSTLTGTASFAVTSSNAMTASSADTLYVRNNITALGSITAQTLVVQTVTSSIDFVTGSTRFGSLQTNTHLFTGSVAITGSLNITGSAPALLSLNSSMLYVSSSGNVGIGTITPSTTLDVVGTGTFSVNVNTGGTNIVHSIGESYGGGIVFYVYDGGKHGLIAATSDQSTGVSWYNGGYAAANTPFDGINAGIRNTSTITAVYQTGSYAAEICAFHNGGNFGDWYLPSKYELNLLYLQKAVVGGFANQNYWSSTELHPNNARASSQYFLNGTQNNHDKSATFYVRAIRAF